MEGGKGKRLERMGKGKEERGKGRVEKEVRKRKGENGCHFNRRFRNERNGMKVGGKMRERSCLGYCEDNLGEIDSVK
jgi:hypothetical protein